MKGLLPTAFLIFSGLSAAAQERPLPPTEAKPTLRLDPGGAAAPVTALAFTPDGRTLFVTGLDKTIRVYRNRAGTWTPDTPLRVPVGTGTAGGVNALAVSPDGRWLAAAGRGPMRHEAGFATAGVVIPAARRSDAMRRDLGVIYLFDLTDPTGGRVLRGHGAEIRGLTFATGAAAATLISAAVEPVEGGKAAGVVRVWDAANGTELAARRDFPASLVRMGLIGWATGAGKTEATVAVAWSEADGADGHLRLWDVARNSVTLKPDGKFNVTLAALRDGTGKVNAVVSGGFAPAGPGMRGRVMVRPVDGGEITTPFPVLNGAQQIPVAAAQAGDGFAVLTFRSPSDPGTRPVDLYLFDRGGKGLTSVPVAGADPDHFPLLAASPNGETLAVAGFRDNGVELYATAELARGRAKPARLAGGPSGYTAVRFLDAGTGLGLTAAGGTEFAFDFGKRSFGPSAGRKPDAPAVTGVGFEPIAEAVRVTARGTAVTCKLLPGAVPTAWAYLPGNPRPLIAVAHEERDQAKSLVTLFDGTNGRPLRQLSGHLGVIRGLAFSAAKPLLASVSADGTVAVWSLNDLDRDTGRIDGLFLTVRDGALVVESVSPEVGTLLGVGDVIDATGGDRPEPVKTTAEFGSRAAAVAPGGTLPVRVRGKNQPVRLPVVRGIDEREPLFFLWVAPGEREWVGWSPAGPFDASGPAAEAKVGWLSNTGNPKAPTTFAGADEYRGEYYRRGLLRFLAEKGELAAALDAHEEDAAPPPPRLAARVGGVVRLGEGKLTVDLDNLAPDYPRTKAVVRYRVRSPGIAAPAWTTAPADGSPPWSFDLSGVVKQRGPYAAEVEFLRRPEGRVVASTVAEFTAAPPAPTLAVTADGVAIAPAGTRTVTVTQPTVRVAATSTGNANEPVGVTIHDGTTEYSRTEVVIALKPGETPVRVRTVHTNATAETRAAETAELTFTVRYDPPKKDPTPAIGPIAFAPAGERTKLRDNDVIAVPAAKVTASAAITASHPLSAVGFVAGSDRPVAIDAAGAKAFTARRELTLEPGKPVRVAISAATANSDAGDRTAEVVYLPVPPKPAVAPPAASVTQPKLTVSGTFAPPADPVPFTIRVIVSAPGSAPAEFDAKLDASAHTWAADVALFPGSNRLSVVTRNEWRTQTLDNAATVAYRRPPRVVTANDAEAGTTAVADMVLAVETPDGLDPRELVVGGRSVPFTSKRLSAAAGVVTWQLTAAAVPVKTTAGWLEKLTVTVRNDDGESTPSVVAVKRAAAKPVAPPRIIVTSANRDGATEAESISVGLRVTSDAAIHRVDVWHKAGAGGEYEQIRGFNPGKRAIGEDAFETAGTAEVSLSPGTNFIRVVAVGDGGEARDEFVVGRTVPPVQVVVEGLEEIAPDGGVARQLRISGRGTEPQFEPSTKGVIAVRGFVRWARPDDPALATPGLTAAVSVNRTNHIPVPLGPAEGGVRRFKSPLFLNGRDNTVRLEVRSGGKDLPQQVGGRMFQVGCTDPLSRQRLHVVVIGVDAPETGRAELARRVVAALGGKANDRFEKGKFDAPGFEEAFVYSPLVGEVLSGDIRLTIADVADSIRNLATSGPQDGWVNDVVLVYYEGKDRVDPDGRRWLHTSRSMRYPEAVWRDYAMPADQLPDSAGVRLLLLSVADPVGQASSAKDSGPAVLRYGWKEPADVPRLLGILQRGLANTGTVGGLFDYVQSARESTGEPFVRVEPEVRGRRLGSGGR